MSIGSGLGVSIGLLIFDNIGLGIPIGTGLGTSIGLVIGANMDKKVKEEGRVI
ncbi:glycine zipper family protein [Senegalia massiliensis]|uniref:Glycine zipper family protein n=1 Tax=Senegalia massiliensis TaxID=1720316 RepID=A0A845QZ70_9CLOT|nr:glycine zipper family protein [Senegalia massiliensis]